MRVSCLGCSHGGQCDREGIHRNPAVHARCSSVIFSVHFFLYPYLLEDKGKALKKKARVANDRREGKASCLALSTSE